MEHYSKEDISNIIGEDLETTEKFLQEMSDAMGIPREYLTVEKEKKE
jgi:hypothetical protein